MMAISQALPRLVGRALPASFLPGLRERYSGVGRTVSCLGYFALLIAVARLPRDVAYRLARQIGRERYRRRRAELEPRVQLAAMQLGATPEEAEGWLERAFVLRTVDDLECWRLAGATPRSLPGLVEFEGDGLLDAALAEGNGAVLYSGHFAGVFLTFAALALRGYKLTLFRAQRLPNRYNAIERWYYGRRLSWLEQRLGVRFLWTQPPNPSIALQASNALKRNEVVLVLMDVWSQAQSVEVEFLGSVANAPIGGYLLAQLGRAPLLGLRMRRGQDALPLRLEFDPALDLAIGRGAVVTKQLGLLEDEIRRDPANWSAMLFRV